MPLLLPDLDDRRWTDLIDEGRALIPLFAPEWTDHNLHDPGITLMELFAAQAELDLYRVNRVPPRHVRKLLSLVEIEPRPPLGSRTVLAFRLREGKPPRLLPADLEIEAEDLAGVRTIFRTLNPVTVVDLRLIALLNASLEEQTPRLRRGETVLPFGDDPAPGAAFYLGFDKPLPVGVPVSLAFTLAFPVSPAPSPHHSARTVWEIRVGPHFWRPLDAGEVVDETRSFTLDGRVVLSVPAKIFGGPIGPIRTDLYFVRCRLVRGAFDAAPELASLSLHAVAAEQAESVEAAIGKGSGEPGQQLDLPKAPVSEGRLELFTAEDFHPPVHGGTEGGLSPGRQVEWTQRPDFDLCTRADSCFLLDATRGRVTFGDGEHGRRARPGSAVSVRYRATRAAEGNLPADRARKIADNPHNRRFPDLNAILADVSEVRNPVPARGGTAAEPLADAAARALESVDRPLRAVTLLDYEQLALETPGVRLARVAARANFDPAFPCFEATGVITVIILPFLPRRRPFPSAGARNAVAVHLGRRRLIGTRVVVIGPTYVEIAVRARVRALRGVDPIELRRRIVEALDRFFHPLLGGSDGRGWPLGRDVFRSEVLQVLDETAGVDHVLDLELIAEGEATCGNVCLGATSLVDSGPHVIDVEGSAP